MFVFGQQGGKWFQRTTLRPPDDTVDDFGLSVAAIPGMILVGARNAAFIYTGSDLLWELHATLPMPGGVADFGSTVALEPETAIVGAPRGAGAVVVFTRDEESWTLDAVLRGNERDAIVALGRSIAFDGRQIAAGRAAPRSCSTVGLADGDRGHAHSSSPFARRFVWRLGRHRPAVRSRGRRRSVAGPTNRRRRVRLREQLRRRRGLLGLSLRGHAPRTRRRRRVRRSRGPRRRHPGGRVARQRPRRNVHLRPHPRQMAPSAQVGRAVAVRQGCGLGRRAGSGFHGRVRALLHDVRRKRLRHPAPASTPDEARPSAAHLGHSDGPSAPRPLAGHRPYLRPGQLEHDAARHRPLRGIHADRVLAAAVLRHAPLRACPCSIRPASGRLPDASARRDELRLQPQNHTRHRGAPSSSGGSSTTAS